MTGETFYGQVRNSAGLTAPLSGKCSPLSSVPEVSAMQFDFTVLGSKQTLVRVLMTGIGYQPDGGNAEFRGGFVAVSPITGLGDGQPIPTSIDVGDTGTGSGTQT
jgi:hypothetical protein